MIADAKIYKSTERTDNLKNWNNELNTLKNAAEDIKEDEGKDST